MANLNIATRSTNGIVIAYPVFADRVLTATGAETWPVGAVLARVTATGKFVRYVPAGSGGAEIPKVVLNAAVEFAAAGDRTERPAVSGHFRREDLVDDAGAAITDLAVEQLRDYSILALTTHQLSEADNS